MSPAELAQLCVTSIEGAEEFGLHIDSAVVIVVLPAGWKPPPKFPRRRLLQDDFGSGDKVWQISAVRLLAWLAAHGLVRLKTKSGTSIG